MCGVRWARVCSLTELGVCEQFDLAAVHIESTS